jgi:hypothetical protein
MEGRRGTEEEAWKDAFGKERGRGAGYLFIVSLDWAGIAARNGRPLVCVRFTGRRPPPP